MSAGTNAIPFPTTDKSTDDSLAGLLGSAWDVNGDRYRLCRASGAIATNAYRCLLRDASANFTSTAVAGAAAVAGTILGVCQYTGGALASGDYFWCITRGRSLVYAEGAVASGAAVAVHAGTGGVDDTTVTFSTLVGFAEIANAGSTTSTMRVTLE